VPIRRTASGVPEVRAAFCLPTDLLEEARGAAVFLAGDSVRLAQPRLVENAFREASRRLPEAYTLARTSLLEPRTSRVADRLPPNCHGTYQYQKASEGC